MKKVFEFIKPALWAIAVITTLQFFGLLSSVTYVAQSALLKTGVMNFRAEPLKKDKPFDYNFTIKDMNGNKISFHEYRGKVIFLNIWATWCGPCRAEMPTIQNTFDKIESSDIVFIMLSIDKEGSQAKIEKYIQDKQYSFPVYMPSGYLPEQLQVPSIPTTYIITKDGFIASKKTGTTNFDTNKFRNYLLELANN
ncbi:MAG: TlpA family protein disulfide reductase [Flammeovirgaceae bacterium]|nr:TlpA family protein disulfide reductase [Flammeovirgaceae bacterium]